MNNTDGPNDKQRRATEAKAAATKPAAKDGAAAANATTAGVQEAPAAAAEKPQKFNAALPFSPFPPFSKLIAERVPLLQVFKLALLEATRLKAGPDRPLCAIECGVYTGNSLLACAQLAEHYNVPLKFFGLDTFSGFPELSPADRKRAPEGSPYLAKTLFADTSAAQVMQLFEDAKLKNVTLLEGLFEESLPLLDDQQFIFVNIDCDLFEGHLQCLEALYPKVVPGGIIYFDDHASKYYPMAKQAIKRFLRDKPETLQFLRYGSPGVNHTKAFLIKH